MNNQSFNQSIGFEEKAYRKSLKRQSKKPSTGKKAQQQAITNNFYHHGSSAGVVLGI
jgi:hypothetical protein